MGTEMENNIRLAALRRADNHGKLVFSSIQALASDGLV
jgi:hypothetical protein